MKALTDLSLPLVVWFSTTQIKPLWIVGRLYCDFLEMCLVLWWTPLCKHHWYDLPFWQITCLMYTSYVCLRGLVFKMTPQLQLIVCNPVLSCSTRLRISLRDFLMALSLHVGWEANHHGGFFQKSQSTSEQRTPACPFASPFSHRSGLSLKPRLYFIFYAYIRVPMLCLIFVTILCMHRLHMRWPH